jgi:hypothetical protein
MQAAGQQLWQRYGLPDFVADLRAFLRDPDAELLKAAQQRLVGFGTPALLVAKYAPSLPLQLHRKLRHLPPDQPLLLQVVDAVPLPLLEERWRLPLKICVELLNSRPFSISCRSPLLEQQNKHIL